MMTGGSKTPNNGASKPPLKKMESAFASFKPLDF
jgi:hypothetical protein